MDEVIDLTYAWNARKRRFSERQIMLALDAKTTGGLQLR